MTKSEELTKYYEENQNEPFYILKMIGDKTSKWLLYPKERDFEIESSCNQIQVLPHWVLWDIDPPKTNNRRDRYEEGLRQAKLIEARLTADNKGFDIHFSGSVGHHIVAKFSKLREYSAQDRQFLKREILKKYGWDTNYDDAKTSSKTTIQMPGTPNRKTLKNKQLVCVFGPLDNEIPQDILTKLMIHKAGLSLRKTIRNEINSDITEGSLRALMTPPLPKCIQYLRDCEVLEDYRERALFSLISHWKHIYHYNELYNKCKEWINKHNKTITSTQLKQKIDSALRTPARTHCGFNKELIKGLGKEDICKDCKFTQ